MSSRRGWPSSDALRKSRTHDRIISIVRNRVARDGAVELLLFGLSDAEASALEEEWRAKLAELFGRGRT